MNNPAKTVTGCLVWVAFAFFVCAGLGSIFFIQDIRKVIDPIICNGRVERAPSSHRGSMPRVICTESDTRKRTDLSALASILDCCPMAFLGGVLIILILARVIISPDQATRRVGRGT